MNSQLHMRDPMDILCKKCHIVEMTGLEVQVYSERILLFLLFFPARSSCGICCVFLCVLQPLLQDRALLQQTDLLRIL